MAYDQLTADMVREINLWQERWDKAVRENERLRAALRRIADYGESTDYVVLVASEALVNEQTTAEKE